MKLIAIVYVLIVAVLVVCVDLVAVPGVLRDNPELPAKIAGEAFVALFDLALVAFAGAALTLVRLR